jgi:hypothetical protein
MNVIRKKQIKYIKLFLISPWLEQVINILYILVLPIFAFYLINASENTPAYSKYELTNEVETYFQANKLKNVFRLNEFESYIDEIMKLLYNNRGRIYNFNKNKI